MVCCIKKFPSLRHGELWCCRNGVAEVLNGAKVLNEAAQQAGADAPEALKESAEDDPDERMEGALP